MYKVNEKTKIGKEIKRIIDDEKLLSFHHSDISFLTNQYEEKTKFNIHIYPNNRIDHLKIDLNNYSGWFTENDIHIPGCIVNCIAGEINKGQYEFPTHPPVINVEFGRTASSSRREKNGITEYPLNSHVQLEELEFLSKNKIKLSHSLNTDNEFTKIKIDSEGFECNTVKTTARVAIDAAMMLLMHHRAI